jgi:lactam utilization protein B
MFVVQYRYRIKPCVIKEFTTIQHRVNEIYKAQGALYQIVIADEECSEQIVETVMFANRSAYEMFGRVTESHLELYSLFQRFKALIAEDCEIEESYYHTIFDVEE